MERAALGTYVRTYGTYADNLSAAGQRAAERRRCRAERLQMRRWLWRHSDYQRTRDCGRKLRTTGDPTLRLSGTSGVDAVMGVAGPVTCGQRTCSVCGPKIGGKLAQQITDTLRVHRDTVRYPEEPPGLGGGCAMVPLTLQHNAGSVLLFLLTVLRYAWSKTTSGVVGPRM